VLVSLMPNRSSANVRSASKVIELLRSKKWR
jgi:hypothetical protein